MLINAVNKPDSGPLPAWTRGATRVLAKTRILELWGVIFSHPARKETGEFTVIHTRDWVNVVATTPDHRMVLVRQFRYGINAPSLEIPGGIIEEIVLEAFDNVLTSAVRQQHDPFRHFFDPLSLAHVKGAEHCLHLFSLVLFGFLDIKVRHG